MVWIGSFSGYPLLCLVLHCLSLCSKQRQLINY
jgi:hypothetical protein